MLNFIAGDLQYFGLNRVVDVRNGEITWSTILEFSERILFYGAGASPDAALADVVNKALEGTNTPPPDTTLSLDQLADDLLQLVIRRGSESNGGAEWSAVGRFRQKRSFWILGPWNRPGKIEVTGSSPDEVLNEVAQRNSRK